MRPRPALLLIAIGLILGALLSAGAPLAAGKGSHGTPADRAATRAYLEARLAYVRAERATDPASVAAVKALAGSIEHECPGVLNGAPHETLASVLGSSERGGRHATPRQQGEGKRHQRQFGALQSELELALQVAELGPAREAALAYVGATRGLRWSEPARTLLTELSNESLERTLKAAAPAVCSDMRAWVSSGYLTLSEATMALERSEEESVARLFATLGGAGNLHLPAPLSRFEGPREKQLERELAAIDASILKTALAQVGTSEQLSVALGLETQAELEAFENPHKGAVVIGHGRTLARTRFKVYVEPPQTEPGPFGATECRHPISVQEEPEGGRTESTIIAGSGSDEGCVSPGKPVVGCEAGAITVELRTAAATRRVRLTLSDGRQVSSRVSHIPAKLGGPAGLYYQAVRGPSPTPVRLEELGGRGRVIRTVEVGHLSRCPPLPSAQPRRRARTIATGALPGGGTFSIRGTLVTYDKQAHFDLVAENNSEPFGSSSLPLAEGGGPARRQPAFVPELETGCRPAEFAIVYGLLRKPHDVVLARTANGPVALRKVKIPKALHAGGALAYVVLGSVPEEVLVRTPTGRTVSRTNLAGKAGEAREVCEGEAEG